MEEELSGAAYRKVFEKLSWLSGVLVEVDDWLEARARAERGPGASERKNVTLENLDGWIARERA